jgi:hypothetical protein
MIRLCTEFDSKRDAQMSELCVDLVVNYSCQFIAVVWQFQHPEQGR